MIEFNNEVYVINNSIIFNPLQRVLQTLTSDEKHSIQTPACLCLVYLLRNQGDVVTRESLIKFAWGEGAITYVTNNTFYQTISHLRKVLDAAGVGNMITTIPRIGLTISAEYSVALQPAEVTAAPVITVEEAPRQPAVRKPQSARLKPVWFAGWCMILFLLPLLTGLLVTRQNDVFSSWKTLPGQFCQVRYKGSDNPDLILQEMMRNQISCTENSAIFVMQNPRVMRTSFLICQHYSSRQQQCQVLLVSRRPAV